MRGFKADVPCRAIELMATKIKLNEQSDNFETDWLDLRLCF